jgi:hypothetical protein
MCAYRPNCTMTLNVAASGPDMVFNQVSLPESITTQYKACKSVVDSTTRLYEYNITKDDAWRLHDTSASSKHLRGVINLRSGNSSQTSDIEARISIDSTSITDANSVVSVQTDSTLSLDYVSAEEDVCTEIKIDIFFRPQQEPPLHLSTLEIRSKTLDIDIGSSLG